MAIHAVGVRRSQSGAALYVSLIILVLMSLIGVVAMQVAGLQERMSANYQASGLAFQNAESTARKTETQLETDVEAGSVVTTNVAPTDCNATHDAEAWTSVTPYIRRMDLCFSWGGKDYGADESERTDQIFEVTAFAKDRAALASSEAVIDTVFIP